MENNSFQRFLSGDKERNSPLAAIFVFLQIIFLIGAGIAIFQLFDERQPIEDDAVVYRNTPELAIEDLSKKIPDLDKKTVKDIEKKLYKIVSENTNNLDPNEVKAVIRDGDIHSEQIDEEVSYINMIVDIPNLEQSYQLFYSPSIVLDIDVSTFVLCLDDNYEIIYQNFDCKSSDDFMTRENIVARFLPYYKFDELLARIEEAPNEIFLLFPDGKDKSQYGNYYVGKIKEKIKSLGVSPDIFNYTLINIDETE